MAARHSGCSSQMARTSSVRTSDQRQELPSLCRRSRKQSGSLAKERRSTNWRNACQPCRVRTLCRRQQVLFGCSHDNWSWQGVQAAPMPKKDSVRAFAELTEPLTMCQNRNLRQITGSHHKCLPQCRPPRRRHSPCDPSTHFGQKGHCQAQHSLACEESYLLLSTDCEKHHAERERSPAPWTRTHVSRQACSLSTESQPLVHCRRCSCRTFLDWTVWSFSSMWWVDSQVAQSSESRIRGSVCWWLAHCRAPPSQWQSDRSSEEHLENESARTLRSQSRLCPCSSILGNEWI